jgi:hypothetical protein
MERFDLGNLADWVPVTHRLDWEVRPYGELVHIKFAVVGQSVTVYAKTDEGTFPLAAGSGWLNVSFTCAGTATVIIMSEAASVRFSDAPNVLPVQPGESFTSLEALGRSSNGYFEMLRERMQRNSEKRRMVMAGLMDPSVLDRD